MALYQPKAAPPQLPGCVRKERCDACENLFAEMCPDVRYTWACAHVYCDPCYQRAKMHAQQPHNLFQYCFKCGGVIIRPDHAYPCRHPVPFVRFRPEEIAPGTEVFPSEFRLVVSQTMGHECQRCSVMAFLRTLTHRLRSEVSVLPYEGEVFACLEVNGHILHGMMNEFPESTVDLANDVAIVYPRSKIEDLVFEISGVLSRFPWEPHFRPLGDIRLTFRVRGWKNWALKFPGIASEVRGVRFQSVH